MKRLLCILLSITCIGCCLNLFSCKNEENTALEFCLPDGAPALAFAKCIFDNQNFIEGVNVNYSVLSSNDITLKMQTGEGDIIVAPVNACSKLYKANKNDTYKMISVVTHGNLYIVSKEHITLQDLKGKVVGVIGQGLVPDLTFKSILKDNSINYQAGDTEKQDTVVIQYFQDATSLISFLKSGKITVGVLPEPAHTLLKSMDSSYSYSLSLQELYDSQNKEYPQAVLMVKQSVISKYPKLADSIKERFTESVSWIKDNIYIAVDSVNNALQQGVTPSLNAQKINLSVIENCNMRWQNSSNAKQSVNNYLQKIIEVLPNSAKLVGEDFYL